eukprot:9495539-Pyramimonas_sp.AAC.1
MKSGSQDDSVSLAKNARAGSSSVNLSCQTSFAGGANVLAVWYVNLLTKIIDLSSTSSTARM